MTQEEKELEQRLQVQSRILLQKHKDEREEPILGFNGYFAFLRTDHTSQVYYEGEFYPSVAHAFEAAKSSDATERRRIRKAPTHKEMLQLAKLIRQPTGWLTRKLPVMEQLLRDKYRREPELRERLAQTGNRSLINLL